jgi:hypothetical protein
LVNGFFTDLATVRSETIHKAKEEVIRHAKETNCSPSQAMRMVRDTIFSEEVWETQPVGRYGRFCTKEILFDFLFSVEAALNRSPDNSCIQEASAQDGSERMRSVRRQQGDSFSPPSGRKPNEQRCNQPSVSLLELSQFLACCADEIAEVAASTNAGTLPVRRRGGQPAFRLADGRTVEGASRAKLLRGIGNAIVPQVAATFIQAFMEVMDMEVEQS